MVRSHSQAKREDMGDGVDTTTSQTVGTRKRSKQPAEPASSAKEAKTTTTAQAKAAATPPPAPELDFEISWENFAKVKEHFNLTPHETNLTLLKILGPDPVMVARYGQDPKEITEPFPTTTPTTGWEDADGVMEGDGEGEEEEGEEEDVPVNPDLPRNGSLADTVETQEIPKETHVENEPLDEKEKTDEFLKDLKKSVESLATPAKAGGVCKHNVPQLP